METDFGQNVATSSAGAVGDFQFLPSTAAQYHYPLTNSPTDAQFAQQANAAAQYLSQLFHQTGSWNTALEHYSGGGYGLSQVEAKAKNSSLVGAGGASPVTNSINNAIGSITSPFADIAKILGFIFSYQFLYVIGGSVLAMLAIYLIAKQTAPGQAAIRTAKNAAATTIE